MKTKLLLSTLTLGLLAATLMADGTPRPRIVLPEVSDAEKPEPAPPPATAAESASAVVKALNEAMNAKDLPALRLRLTKYAGASAEVTAWLEEREQKLLKLGDAGWTREVLEEKVEGDCAVVVVNEAVKNGRPAFDLDPAFLIRQDGQWRVFHKITQWDLSEYIPEDHQPASMKLTAEQKKAYTVLAEWFETRTKALREERRAKQKPASPPPGK